MSGILFDIAANIVSLQQDFNKAHNEINRFTRNTERVFRQLQGVIGGIGLSYAIKDTVSAFMEQERAIMKMATAMKNQGDYTREAVRDMESFASRIQETTTVADDMALAMAANLKSYGMTNDEVKKATQVAIDFAAAKKEEGMQATTAAELLGKAYAGNTATLSRYGIIIDDTLKGADRFRAVMEQLQARFGGAAQADLETYSGKLQQLKNDFGDLKEAAGEALIKKFATVMQALMGLGQGLYLVGAAGREFSAWIAEKKAGALDFFGSIETRDLLLKQAENLRAAAKEFRGFAEEAGLAAQKMWELGETTKNVDKAMAKMKDGMRTDKPIDADIVNLLAKSTEDNFKRMVDALNDFEKEHYAATHSVTKTDLRELQIRYDRYKEFVKDEARLEEWLAAEKRNILVKSNNERIALFEELYKSSKQQEFADQALKAMQEVLDIEEKKWADILKNDQWAHDLRLQREREYIDKLKAMIPEVVDAWAIAQEKIVYEYSLPKYLEQGGQVSSEGIVSGFPVGPGSGGPMIGQNNYSGLLDQIATNTKNIAEDANRTAQMQAEEAQREQQRLMEERQRAFQVGYSRFQAFAQTRERVTWGGVEWATEFERLGKSFTETTDYQKSLQILNDMLSALEQIESIEKAATSQNETLQKNLAQSNESISKWLSSLEASGAAPVQSSASLALQFEEYKKKAFGDLQYVNEFLNIASQYLSFEKTFGSTESYKSVYDAVVKSVKAVQEEHKLYEDFSALGLGNTISELKLLKDGFETLGISTDALKKAAAAARTSTDSASSSILTFGNTQGTAAWLTKSAYEKQQTALSALYWSFYSAGLSTDSFTGKIKLMPDAVSMALGDKGLAKLTDSLINSLPKSITTAVGSTGLSSLYTYIAGWIPAAVSAATTEENGIQKVKKELGENLPASIKTLLGPENTKALIDELATNLPKSVKDAVGLTDDTGLQKLLKALGITGDTAEESSPKLTTVSGSLAATTLNIQTKLAEIGAFFDTLATKMNINLNPTSAEQAIKNLTPAALWQAVTTQVAAYWVNIRTGIQSTFQGYPSQDWNYVPAQTGTRLFNPSTGEWKGRGGLTSGLAMAGEIGPEWVVPTYEPQRSAFLQSVGVDSAEIGKQIAAQLGGGQPVHVHIEVDGREIAYAVVRQARSNADIADGFRRLS